MKYSEVFKSIQGEGQCAGIPSIFLRLSGCNLRCSFRNGSICDTPYTSHSIENDVKDISVDELVKVITDLGFGDGISHLVITGGEPMIQQGPLVELLQKLYSWHEDMHVTIETNGTIEPTKDLLNVVDLWSVSPKLNNSCYFPADSKVSKERQEHHKKTRFNPGALFCIIRNGCSVQLKFVYSGKETEDEVKQFLSDCERCWKKDRLYDYDEVGVNTNKVLGIEDGLISLMRWDGTCDIMLMPEGINEEQCHSIAEECVEVCIKNGWRYCHRVHIRIWGDKRGV